MSEADDDTLHQLANDVIEHQGRDPGEAEILAVRVLEGPDGPTPSAASDAFDTIAKLVGCPEWGYPGQLVRDVEALKKERDDTALSLTEYKRLYDNALDLVREREAAVTVAKAEAAAARNMNSPLVASLVKQLGGKAEISRSFIESYGGTITRSDSPLGTVTLALWEGT